MRWTKRYLPYALLAVGALGTAATLSLLDIERPRPAEAALPEMVPVEIVLLVDTSGSVDEFEYQMQQEGYVQAFRNAELTSLIESQGGIAVAYIEWSSVNHQVVRLDWTRLDTEADCLAFSSQIAALGRQVEGDTRMAPALQFAADQMSSNNFVGLKQVIDVSGDGRCQNYDYYLTEEIQNPDYGVPWDEVIPNISGDVDQVNGICITSDTSVADFYRDILPQGADSFMMQVADFTQFEEAILEKLRREIAAIPGMYD